jgi:hypothetical protein
MDAEQAAYRCATIGYLTDPSSETTVPVGVVLWNAGTGWWRIRVPQQDGALPYSREPLAPWSEAWWEQVRRLMQFTIRMGPAQIVDCRDPEREIEALFEGLVRPRRGQTTSGRR